MESVMACDLLHGHVTLGSKTLRMERAYTPPRLVVSQLQALALRADHD